MIKKIIEKLYLSLTDNLVYYDSVSKCKSRYYYDNIALTKYNKKACIVIFVDIDNLKKINDEKGHEYGTLVIKNVTKELLSFKNVYDVCRIGGDEFIMFTALEFDLNQLSKIQNASYGYYCKSIDESTIECVNKADKKMYEHKKGKK